MSEQITIEEVEALIASTEKTIQDTAEYLADYEREEKYNALEETIGDLQEQTDALISEAAELSEQCTQILAGDEYDDDEDLEEDDAELPDETETALSHSSDDGPEEEDYDPEWEFSRLNTSY